MKESVRLVDRVVVPVQGTDREYLAQQRAVELAAALEVPVRAVHVAAPGTEANGDVFDYLARQAKEWEVRLDAATIEGDDVVKELVDEVGPLDLIVMGTRQMKGRYHVGSVAAELLRRAPCPVQMVRLE